MKYDAKEHWENIWTTKKSNEVSWYQEEPKKSIEMILSTNPSKDAHIIDVGGGDAIIMMSDEFPDMGAKSPKSIGGTPITIHLYVDNADTIFNQAVNAGAKVIMPIMDAFWGDRYGLVADPDGHSWAIATHKKDMSPEEMRKAGEDFFCNMGKQ